MTNREEIERRRTFAIISHPDAGKTTLTEKLLLYGGAINQAGSVKGKQRAKLPPACGETMPASGGTVWMPRAIRTSRRIPTAP